MTDIENKFRGTFNNGSQNIFFPGNNIIPMKQSFAECKSTKNMGFNNMKKQISVLQQPKTHNLSPRQAKMISDREKSATTFQKKGPWHYQDSFFNQNTSSNQVKKQLYSSKSDNYLNYAQLQPKDFNKLTKNESVDFLNQPISDLNQSLEKRRNSSIDVKKQFFPKDQIKWNDRTGGPLTSLQQIQSVYNLGMQKEVPNYSRKIQINQNQKQSLQYQKIRKYFNHKNGKDTNNKTNQMISYIDSSINLKPKSNNGHVSQQQQYLDYTNRRSNDFINYTNNQTFLSNKAYDVTNNSIQNHMKNLKKIHDARKGNQVRAVTGLASYETKKRYQRFDQTPQPVYPNFEPKKQGKSLDRLAKPQMGEIGWGVDDPHLNFKGVIKNDQICKEYINSINLNENQKFNKLTGNFTNMHDKQMNINSEIYHLMNVSAQRISVKSLDMQRKADNNYERKTSSQSPLKFMNIQNNQSQQSFPEVMSVLNNPFQRNNLNFAIKNNQPIITPVMAHKMRLSRGYNRSNPRNIRAKTYGVK